MFDAKYMSWPTLLEALGRIFGKAPSEMTVRRWQKRSVNPFPMHRRGPGGMYFITKEVEAWFSRQAAVA